ncbi:hypothetical protein N7462_004105 [Penicillium macrosclerotiorum]|uniref:uncharacterized protein n=1 Tax=Penicillium macrosclerotiorum TaxID=303699 RepID=UPI002546F27B|nr:uncharacterized protein N7462_004105 [Penicillium macrosclerotiorum]KAJ5689713.1 hypothetical protein N7462_004105 [Penicillium macrosclerotiorum]
MGGVPGRSKGCKTCRRRKVKCGAMVPCEGYNPYPEFVNLSITSKYQKARPQKAVQHLYRSQPASTNLGISESSVTAFPFLSLEKPPAWDEQSVFTSHLMNRLFTWHEDPSSPYSVSWVSVLLEPVEEDRMLSSTSIRALATLYFGKIHHETQLVHKGVRFYSQALQALRSQLQHRDLMLEDDVLVAILVMGVYELVAFTQPAGWLQHYKGLARLTAMRGPERHQSGIGFAVYPTLRSCIAIGCIVDRKRCFLESREWKTVPWAQRGIHTKTALDRLYDILCDIPGIIEDTDKLMKWDADASGYEDFRVSYCSRALAVLQALFSWRWDWEKQFPNASYAIPSDAVDQELNLPLPPTPFETILWFQDAFRATELSIYNAQRLIITRSLEMAGVPVNLSSSETSPSDPLLPIQGTRHDVAVEICRMAQYQLHSLRRSSGAFALIFPLNVAYLHLGDYDSNVYKPWLDAVMSLVADSHGFEIGRTGNMPRQAIRTSPILKVALV